MKDASKPKNQFQVKPALRQVIWNGVIFSFDVLDPLFGKHIVYTQQVENFKGKNSVCKIAVPES
jgi:hypothetical protein